MYTLDCQKITACVRY